MTHQGTPASIQWRKQSYRIQWSVTDGQASVQVEPFNAELEDAVRRDIETEPLKQLKVYKGLGYDYLASDSQRGE